MNPSFQLIDGGWDKVIQEATLADRSGLHVVCPFIKYSSAKRLLGFKRPDLIRVVTRFHLGEMCDGVNDTAALRLLLDNGAKIRGVRNLHAKLYLFGNKRAIVTSANLTESGLLRNHEFGFVCSERGIIQQCLDYFESLWKKAGPDLDPTRLEGWEKRIKSVKLAGSRPTIASGLSDEGTDAGLKLPEVVALSSVAEAPQAFVKFFGEGNYRSPLSLPTLDEVERTGCHWACGYPKKKRPRQVNDGAVMFMGRLVKDPNDVIIYGRAIGLKHVEGRDEASQEEIKHRTWKAEWPIYVRVHHAEFVAGTLNNGIKLSALMDQLKSNSFISTQENAQAGIGNSDPRSACRQKAAMPLTKEAFHWLNDRLEQAFVKQGKLTPAELETLDWPATTFQTVPLPANLPKYQQWLEAANQKASGTAKIYARFLTRCAKHYGEVINEKTVRTEADVEGIVERVSRVVAARDRWADGTFNKFDIADNLIPALRAYTRFVKANFRPKHI